jgi:hypothetical protein
MEPYALRILNAMEDNEQHCLDARPVYGAGAMGVILHDLPFAGILP